MKYRRKFEKRWKRQLNTSRFAVELQRLLLQNAARDRELDSSRESEDATRNLGSDAKKVAYPFDQPGFMYTR